MTSHERASPSSESQQMDGGNRTRLTNGSNDLSPNELQNKENSLGVFWEWTRGCDCRCLTSLGKENAESLRPLIAAWPHLQPHIREAIFTLIDASLSQQSLAGGES